MNSFSTFFVSALPILLLIGVGVFKSSQINSEEKYLFAARETKWVALTATLVMTEFNSATLISFASLGYLWGFWALLLPGIFLIGLLFYAVTVARKWKAFDGVSVAGFFTERYGAKIGLCASVLLLFASLGFSAAYIKSLTLLFLPLFPGLNSWLLSGILLFVVLLMSLRGGLSAIIRTDLFSFIFVALFFPALAIFMANSSILPPVSHLHLPSHEQVAPLRLITSLTILTMFTYILAPWYGQKIFAAETPKVAYRSVVAAALIIFFLYGSAILAVIFFRSRGFEVSSPEMAFPQMLKSCLPFGLQGFAYALLFLTSATTLTGVWSAMTAMCIGDLFINPGRKQMTIACCGLAKFYPAEPAVATQHCPILQDKIWRCLAGALCHLFTARVNKKSDSSPNPPGVGRSIVTTLLFALASLTLANTLVDRVFDKMILANIPVAALSFGLLAGFYWKKASARGVLFSVLMGCIGGVFSYLIFGEEGGYTWYWAVYGIPLTFLTGITASLLLPDRSIVANSKPL